MRARSKIGKGEVLQDGNDVAIIATGLMSWEALQAGTILKEKGIHARIINMCSIKPLDEEMVLKSAAERGFGEQYYDNNVKPFIHDYMGQIFETICQEYVLRTGMIGEYGGVLTQTGKWRGNDPIRKCPADIDVVGIDAISKSAVIGECKFKNTSFGKEEFETLMDRSRLISPYIVEKYLIFSLSGVTKWVLEQDVPEVGFIPMEKLFSAD